MTISVQTGSLDIPGLVTSLMSAEKKPLTTMNSEKSTATAKVNNLGKIVTAANNLDTKAKALGKISTMTKEQATTAVKEFITAYNSLSSDSKTLTAKGGALQGDASVSSVSSRLRSNLWMSSAVGNISSMSQLGITTSKEGTLTLDETKFGAIFDSDTADVKTVLSELANKIDSNVGSGSTMDTTIKQRQEALNSRIKRIDDKIERFNDSLSKKENTYYAQFITLQKSMNSISNSFNLSGLISSSSS